MHLGSGYFPLMANNNSEGVFVISTRKEIKSTLFLHLDSNLNKSPFHTCKLPRKVGNSFTDLLMKGHPVSFLSGHLNTLFSLGI